MNSEEGFRFQLEPHHADERAQMVSQHDAIAGRHGVLSFAFWRGQHEFGHDADAEDVISGDDVAVKAAIAEKSRQCLQFNLVRRDSIQC
jgi:hypothetical protein